MKDQTRNLNPHKPARAAMFMYGAEYARQGGGSMDFWDGLDRRRKELCRQLVSEVIASRSEKDSEASR